MRKDKTEMSQSREDKLWSAHGKEGKKRFGSRWKDANTGWYSEQDSVSSKVYGKPCMIFTSYYHNYEIYHEEDHYHG